MSDTHDDPVLPALRKVDGKAHAIAPRRWKATVSNGHAIDIMVRCHDDNWFELSTDPFGVDLALMHVLEINGTLPGSAKLVLDRRGLAAKVDVPSEEGRDVQTRIIEGCDGIRAAGTHLHAEARHEGQDGRGGEGLPAASEIDIAGLVAEAGWPGNRRDSGAVAVELAAPGFVQAEVEATPRGVRAAVDLGPLDGAPASRAAASGLLLVTSGWVRLARAAIRTDAGVPRARIEVAYGPGVDAFEMRCAFEALSVACQLLSEELRAVKDEEVARHWLAARRLPACA